MSTMPRHFASRHVLVVEDDYLLASELEHALEAAHVNVVGPVANVHDALAAIRKEHIDAAILEIRLGSSNAFEAAEALTQRGIPFMFGTGFDIDQIPPMFSEVPTLQKPFHVGKVVSWLSGSIEPIGESARDADVSRNQLLSQMSAHVIEELRPHMTRTRLRSRSVLSRFGKPIERVYFPESGICSMLAGKGDYIAEIALIGREGMTGASLLFGQTTSLLQTMVQSDGWAISISAEAWAKALPRFPELHSIALKYAYAFNAQVAHGAVANAACTLEQRLARWLLMCQDRVGPDLAIVQEFLALMLHARRPSVTVALRALEAEGALEVSRGRTTIINRGRLLDIAGPSYGVPEAEYRRLFGGREAT
jgi:CRP-like cAMP-binding protein